MGLLGLYRRHFIFAGLLHLTTYRKMLLGNTGLDTDSSPFTVTYQHVFIPTIEYNVLFSKIWGMANNNKCAEYAQYVTVEELAVCYKHSQSVTVQSPVPKPPYQRI